MSSESTVKLPVRAISALLQLAFSPMITLTPSQREAPVSQEVNPRSHIVAGVGTPKKTLPVPAGIE